MFLTIMYFSFLLWASISAAIQPGLSSSNVLCFIVIVGIVSFEQMNRSTARVTTRRVAQSQEGQ